MKHLSRSFLKKRLSSFGVHLRQAQENQVADHRRHGRDTADQVAGPVAVDGFTGRAFHAHDATWDWSAVKQVAGAGWDAVKNYSESVTLARRSGQKAGLRKGVVYRASNGDPEQVYEARAHGLEALCGTVRALSRRAGGGCYRVEDIRDGETVALFLGGEQIAS